MKKEPQGQSTGPCYALQCNALDDPGQYSNETHSCKPDVHARMSADHGCTHTKTTTATQVLQLLTAIAALLVIVVPVIMKLG